MKIYTLNGKKYASEIKRLVNLKAALGVCDWAGDFNDVDFDIDSLMEYIQIRIEDIKDKCQIVKSLSEDEERTYFNELKQYNSDVNKTLSCGVIDANGVSLLKKTNNVPSILEDIIDNVYDDIFLWMV